LSGLDNVRLHLVDDFDTAWELMRWLEERTYVAVDTETTGLVIGHDRVRMVQVGGLDAGWAIPWDRWSGLFEDIVKRFTGRFIMHNAKFDAGMSSHMGIDVPRHRIDDTRIMSHILEPNYSTGLKQQATRHVDAASAGAQQELEQAIKTYGWGGVPITYPGYWQYAALDTVLTAHLYEHHWPLIQPFLKSYELENAVQWTIEKMERYGAHIDVAYTIDHLQRFNISVEQAAEEVQLRWGVSPGSNQAVIRILQDAGFEFTKATASGAVSLDKEVLDGIDHPLAELVLRRRQRQKLASTYLKHFVEEHDDQDLIHPSINTLGARTSRMSMERPNLQNLPRKSERNPDAQVVRNCITAREGHTLLMCDFDQIEMRLLGHMSQDPGLIAAFQQPDDFFVTLAREIFLDPLLQKSDPRRSVTKNVGYAQIYGAGVDKMAQTAGVPRQQVQVVKTRFDTLYPGVNRFIKAVERVAWDRQRGEGVPYAKSVVTGRHHVADTNKIYALVNYLIQGTAAEVFKQKILQLDAAGLGDYMMVPVHDEIILDVPDEDVPDAIQTLRDNMNDYESFAVPITASVSMGQRWGAKEEVSV
jgi:DNA polymerase-1